MFSDQDRPGPRRRAISAICGGIFLLGASGHASFAQTAKASPAATNSALGGIGTVRALTGTGGLGRQEPLPMMQPGMDIFNGDRARTEAESRAHLGFGTATELFLGPDSEVLIDAFIAGSGGVIYLDGALLFERPDGSTDPEAEVVTDYGRIGVRGTRFFAAIGLDGLAVFVERGAVVVSGTDAGQEGVMLGPGQGTVISEPGRAPNPPNLWSEARIAALKTLVLGEGGGAAGQP